MNAALDAIRWYAVHTRPQSERLASRLLRQQGYWTFCPFDRIKRRRKMPGKRHRIEIVERPHFPRYIFAALRGREGESIGAINNTIGVSTVVYFSGQPLEIPNPVMTELMAKADAEGLISAEDLVSRKKHVPGTRFRFKEDSPFGGLMAEIILDDGNEVRIWLDMLGSKREIPVSPDSIGDLVYIPHESQRANGEKTGS